MKPYSRFYQYTYVAIYRELKAAAQQAEEPELSADDLSFEPIESCPVTTNYRPLRNTQNILYRVLNPPGQDCKVALRT